MSFNYKKSPMKHSSAFSMVEISVVVLIIGILIAGISKGTDLYQEYRINSARSLTTNSVVPRIADLNLWLETTNQKSIQNSNDSFAISDGQNIKNWFETNPLSIKKLIANQNSESSQPKYKINGISGLPSVFFDANATGSAGKSLTIAYNDSLNTPTFTIFIVTQPAEVTSEWGAIFMSRTSSSPLRGYNFYKNQNNTGYEFWIGDNTIWRNLVSGSIIFNRPIIATLLHKASSKSLYINSALQGSDNFVALKNTVNPVIMGQEYGNRYFFDGYISEVIYYGRDLADNERTLVENYLKQKYQIR